MEPPSNSPKRATTRRAAAPGPPLVVVQQDVGNVVPILLQASSVCCMNLGQDLHVYVSSSDMTMHGVAAEQIWNQSAEKDEPRNSAVLPHQRTSALSAKWRAALLRSGSDTAQLPTNLWTADPALTVTSKTSPLDWT